ncbi:MAG TPA: Gfo/Idh/MocA family oxidoreductase [Planctomycetaceae bacterium]|nr:Gfo/Idh/MocA family oxidoreductase [Planctomycetaceae bacterium]
MINIGIIGLGFMGYTHFTGAQKLTGGRVSAIATRNEKKRQGDWTSIQGNFGPRGGQVDLSGVATYADYHDLLADPNVDLVDICLPTDQHEQVVLDSIAAGKATIVEKPIAIDLAAAERMVAAAEQAKVPLMVAHVLPFMPEFRFAAETIASGKYGKLRAAHFRRVIAPPEWSSDMSDFKKLGGWGIDLHIHDNHFIGLACGVPSGVFSTGIQQGGLVNHVHSQYLYEGRRDLAVSCVSGGIAAPGYAFGHGFEIYLERATLMFDFATLGGEPTVNLPLTLLDSTGAVIHPTLEGGGEWCAAFTAELQTAVDGLEQGKIPEILSADLACNALKLCYAEAKSIETGQPVEL